MSSSKKVGRKKIKKEYMSDERFSELEESLNEALAFSRGEKIDLRVTGIKLPDAPKPISQKNIIRIRKQLNCSQAIFARLLNVSVKTVQAWEQGERNPSEAALKLLDIARKDPSVLWK
jgi:putative transcriptional regulator